MAIRMQNVEINIIGVLVSALLVLLLAVCILYILYQYKKRQHFFLKEVELLRLNYEKELLQAELEIQEQTLQHISLELHDNVGHYISLAKLHLLTLTPADKEFANKLETSVELLGTSLQEIRNLCTDLNTSYLRNNGLIKTVEQQVQQLAKSGRYEVAYSVNGNTLYMDEKKELILFRIIQEALNNIIKHSQASQIFIHLQYLEHVMELTIGDNGKGFDVEGFFHQQSLRSSGLQNIINRINIIQATHRLTSMAGKGTTLQITTPY